MFNMSKLILLIHLSIIFHYVILTVAAVDPWSFIVIADWHGAESFSIIPINDDNANTTTNVEYHGYGDVLRHIKSVHGGELVLLPGDSNTGHWYTPDFSKKFQDYMKRSMTTNEIIRSAGKNCYSTLKRLFKESGYERILLTMGDHELGGNPWKSGPKYVGLSSFRDSLSEELNEEDGVFIHTKPIGKAPPNPVGTPFEKTSYAYVHKNALFVTVDTFHDVGEIFYDRVNNEGGEGKVTCTVEGVHLAWFEFVLSEARKDASINHIFVQGHVPIMQPVRKMSSSGQFFDRGTDSDFWKVMQQYNVSVYFAGEVHANTALKDPDSSLIQVTSRGNRLQNFLSVEITEDEFRITAFNEIGSLPWFNANYTKFGELVVRKNGETSNIVRSSGMLKIVNDGKGPLLRYKFDQSDEYFHNERQIVGMKYDQFGETLIGSSISIRNETISTKGLRNRGRFGKQYDLQLANHQYDVGVDGKDAIVFTSDTRVAVYSMGPMGAGEKVSCSLYFKTTKTKEMILVFYGGIFGYNKQKDIFLLTINEGKPFLYMSEDSYITSDKSTNLADGKWHHIAVSMRSNSCLPSEMLMFIDGKRVRTSVHGKDRNIFFITTGRLSIGGWGYSSETFGTDLFSNVEHFDGMIDEFRLWGGTPQPVNKSTLKGSIKKQFEKNFNTRCKTDENSERVRIGRKLAASRCKNLCNYDPSCTGYEVVKRKAGRKYKCYHYKSELKLGNPEALSQCNPVIGYK